MPLFQVPVSIWIDIKAEDPQDAWTKVSELIMPNMEVLFQKLDYAEDVVDANATVDEPEEIEDED